MIQVLAVWTGLFAYFVLFNTYGFLVEDEGTLLFQLTRVQSGQVPYVDFHTGYTPGYYYFGARLLEALGNSTAHVRIFLAVMNAVTGGVLYLVARRLTGPWMSLLPPLIWVAFIPTFLGDFAAFNVPYPAWFAALCWVLLALVLLEWADSGRLAWVAVAGLLCALSFAIKLNAGAYSLAATAWIIARFSRAEGRVDRMASMTAPVFMALGVWFTFGFALASLEAMVLLLPMAAIAAWSAARPANDDSISTPARAMPALTVLAVVFVALSLVWVVPVFSQLGTDRFAREVLLIGSSAADLYYIEYPPPGAYAAAVMAAVIVFAVTARLIGKGRLSVAMVALVGLGGLGLAAAYLSRTVIMPEGFRQALVDQLEHAAFWLTPLAHWGGIILLLRPAVELQRARALAVILPLAVAMYLQVYPRCDFMHVVISVPLSIVMATALLSRVIRWLEAGRWPAFLPGRACMNVTLVAVVAAVIVLKVGPVTTAAFAHVRHGTLQVSTPTVAAGLEAEAADDLEAFGLAAEYLRRHAREGEPVLSFPAMSGLLFATGHSNPVHHDYWFPGRPDHDEEAKMLAVIRASPPRFVVTLNDGWGFFRGSPRYYEAAGDYVRTSYRLVGRFGRFDILARSELAASLPKIVRTREGPATDAVEQVLPWRRQAARRWMAALTPEDAQAADLESDTRSATLRLEAIRDGGDMRAAAWIVQGYGSGDDRVRHEALAAMKMVSERYAAARGRWAGDFDGGFYLDYVSGIAEQAGSWNDDHPRVTAFKSALLSVLESD